MKFEFAKYTDITKLAFENNTDYSEKGGNRKFFICPDVHDFWYVRILEGINEDYEEEEGCFLIERNKIANDFKGQDLTVQKVIEIIKDDDGDNWDAFQADSLEEAIDMLDDGFGIN